MAAALSRAVSEWLEVTGTVHMEALAKKYNGKVLQMPSPASEDSAPRPNLGRNRKPAGFPGPAQLATKIRHAI